MTRYIIVSLVSGLAFGVLDGLINANPFAAKLHEVYRPIARPKINIPAGFVIDIFYGFVMTGCFILLAPSLPGQTHMLKGLSYALVLWFFRVFMYGLSHWMMYEISIGVLMYTILSGLIEMIALGLFYGLTL